MEKLEGILLLTQIISLILILVACVLEELRIKRYEGENIGLYSKNKGLRFELEEAKFDQRNAEARATDYAKKIKAIEDILKEAKAKKENFCTTIEKLEKELFTDTNQTK